MGKYYISADLEGVWGVTSPLQCHPKAEHHDDYKEAVYQLALEIDAVVNTLLDNVQADTGVGSYNSPDAYILVNDAHGRMTNLSQPVISSKIRLLSGKPKSCAMMAGLDETFDAAFFIGYHAKAGSEAAVLNHTFHHKIYDLQINGISYGEGGINALYASLVHRVPVVLASGDRAFCHEILKLIPDIRTVETKSAISSTAALSPPWESVLQKYQQQTENILEELKQRSDSQTKRDLLELTSPYTLRIGFIDTLSCDTAMTSPLYRRVDGRAVEMTTDNVSILYQGIQTAYALLSYTSYLEW